MKKTAIVAGASKGIAWRLSKALLEQGFEVIAEKRRTVENGIVPSFRS